MTLCPQCDVEVMIGQPRLHEIVECGECRNELEVVSLQPPLLALAPEVEEDWGE